MVAFLGLCFTLRAEPDPGHWQWAPTPPMGWNSYDAWGTSITETQTLAEGQYMRDHLRSHGWLYVVIDARWYDSDSPLNDRDLKKRSGAQLAADGYGRLLPAVNRFPSAAGGRGFKPLAGRIHAMGLRFGIHLMRGVPRQAFAAHTPIEGSPFSAADTAETTDTCAWCPDMYGVKANAAGQDWYDSLFRLYASWDIDFVKVDDLSRPYHAEEIAMIRKAIDRSGRPIVFSTSPGATDFARAGEIKLLANQWRISDDFWDRWTDLDQQFDRLARWAGESGPGHYPDADMIPVGHIGIECRIAGDDRQTRFTHDEQRTLVSLWSLASSPLMLGANLTDLDAWTLALLTNDEVLAVDQDALARSARRVNQRDGLEVWVKERQGGARTIGLFNRTAKAASATLDWAEAGLSGPQNLRDLWEHRDLGRFERSFSAAVAPHGVLLLQATP